MPLLIKIIVEKLFDASPKKTARKPDKEDETRLENVYIFYYILFLCTNSCFLAYNELVFFGSRKKFLLLGNLFSAK